jgi:hypothetical protein
MRHCPRYLGTGRKRLCCFQSPRPGGWRRTAKSPGEIRLVADQHLSHAAHVIRCAQFESNGRRPRLKPSRADDADCPCGRRGVQSIVSVAGAEMFPALSWYRTWTVLLPSPALSVHALLVAQLSQADQLLSSLLKLICATPLVVSVALRVRVTLVETAGAVRKHVDNSLAIWRTPR